MCDTYDGWTNRETWAVDLLIENTQPVQSVVNQGLSNYWANSTKSDFVRHSYDAAKIVEDVVTAYLDAMRAFGYINIAADIGSVWRVNWSELATNRLKEF